MGRSISRDRLPDKLAAKVRHAIREARRRKRVTNVEISRYLGWGETPRRVVDMLATGRPLRLKNAQALLAALREIGSGRTGATRVLSRASVLIERRMNPPVLIPRWVLNELVDYFADELARKRGVGRNRRDAFARDVRWVAARTSADMAHSFFDRYRDLFHGGPSTAGLMKRFGFVLAREASHK